ncbi:hypothetical protein DH2020_001176 [Rehmannia glutinosa]|uniref:Gag-pol polyprotein n=1 Tax=Rehmannia glutinosa TaxID=99300 RepID=A0ABR0XYP6_REHGL
MSMMRELTFFLGLQVKQLKDGTFICQTKYTRDLMKKFGMEEKSSVKILMNTSVKMDMDADGKDVDQTRYRALIGSLLYLTANRPDITFAVGVCARFQSAPKESHMTAARRIIRYLKGCQEFGLWYPKEANLNLTAFSDSDWATDIDDRRTTSGFCVYLGSNLVSWSSKKQHTVSKSSTESEYTTLRSFCSQILWMIQVLTDYGVEEKTLTTYCDNSSAINIFKNPVQHSRTKHIDIRHHFIRDLVKNKIVIIDFVT